MLNKFMDILLFVVCVVVALSELYKGNFEHVLVLGGVAYLIASYRGW